VHFWSFSASAETCLLISILLNATFPPLHCKVMFYIAVELLKLTIVIMSLYLSYTSLDTLQIHGDPYIASVVLL
jgi:hypothetical protein